MDGTRRGKHLEVRYVCDERELCLIEMCFSSTRMYVCGYLSLATLCLILLGISALGKGEFPPCFLKKILFLKNIFALLVKCIRYDY